MSVTDWKLEKDLCRCCHAEGSFKNLSVPCYKYDGEEEIYVDMIRDHMNLDIIQVQGALQSVTFTICDLCIAKLRDVTTFRRQVMSCEERFRDMYSRNVFKVGETTPDVKVEVIELDDFGDVKGEDNDDDDFTMNFSDEEDIKAEVLIDIKQEPSKKGKGKGKATPKAKKRPAPKRAAKAKKGKKAGGDGEEDKVDDADKAEDEAEATASLADTTKRASKRELITLEDYLRLENLKLPTDKKTPIACEKCSHVRSNWAWMRSHIRDQHLPVQCGICDLKMDGWKNIEIHMADIHEQKFNCNKCNKSYKTEATYLDHLKCLHRLKKCDSCPLMFTKMQMGRHCHDSHGRPFPTCGVCGYKSRSQSDINQHQQEVHLKEKRFSCDQCTFTFYRKRALKRHMFTHLEEKRFQCQYCKKRFRTNGNLHQHVMIHTGEKNKVCTVCGEKFVQKASLNYHMTKNHMGHH